MWVVGPPSLQRSFPSLPEVAARSRNGAQRLRHLLARRNCQRRRHKKGSSLPIRGPQALAQRTPTAPDQERRAARVQRPPSSEQHAQPIFLASARALLQVPSAPTRLACLWVRALVLLRLPCTACASFMCYRCISNGSSTCSRRAIMASMRRCAEEARDEVGFLHSVCGMSGAFTQTNTQTDRQTDTEGPGEVVSVPKSHAKYWATLHTHAARS